MQDAEKNGVDVFTGVNVTGVEKTSSGVRVTANGETFEGTFVIGADGTGSRVAALMGFNKDRRYYTSAPGLTYYVTGLEMPQTEKLITANCFKPNATTPTFFWIMPSPYAQDEYWMCFQLAEQFDYITKESVFAKWFPNVKVTRIWPFVTHSWEPVAEPYKDNVLLVGDSTWFGEAEITGSMMCGWKAANSISVALRDNKPNREGILNYIEWWKRSYPEFDDYRNFYLFMPFCFIFSKEELIYLYGLFKKPLLPNNNPFLVVRLVKKALEPMMPQIEQEMPSLAKKLDMLEIDKLDDILKQASVKKHGKG
jgi:flavin-dependent dehydrogenase